MAHFFELQANMDAATRQFFEMTQAASDNKPKELAAATVIQSVWRASRVRERWHAVVAATVLVQRVGRGWLARARAQIRRWERYRQTNNLFFEHCATIIQKFYRGWWSRRSLHDFYGRKDYLAKVERRGAHTVEYLKKERRHKHRESKLQEEEQMRGEFDKLAGELHHLVSTKTIAGVYNPPYSDVLPSAFEKPIEQHLRDCCTVQVPRSLRRPKHRVISASPRRDPNERDRSVNGITQAEVRNFSGGTYGPPQDLPDRQAHQASRSANAGRMQKIQGPFRSQEQIEISNAKARNVFGSIQAGTGYQVVEDDMKMQKRLDKMMRVSPIDFMAPGQPRQMPPATSVHVNLPHNDRPVEMRADYLELPKIRDKPPFLTAMPSGKTFEDYADTSLLPAGHI
jgi:hypothetical protein